MSVLSGDGMVWRWKGGWREGIWCGVGEGYTWRRVELEMGMELEMGVELERVYMEGCGVGVGCGVGEGYTWRGVELEMGVELERGIHGGVWSWRWAMLEWEESNLA